jgi:EmrB/QacA subfamily drug resistance transporter
MYTELSSKRKKVVLAGILMGMFLSAMTNTTVSTAMPRILSALGGMEYISWALTAYMLTSTISMPIFGKLADMYGRKPFYIGGIIVFCIGCILCGTAVNMTQFIIYRAVAGLGGGIMQANSMAIVADIFPPAQRGKYQGLMGAVFALSSVIGPALGGYVADHLSWSWVFWVNVPIGLVAILFLFIGLPKIKLDGNKRIIDYIGAALLITSFAPMLLAFSWAGKKYTWESKEILGMLAISIISLILFVLQEKKAKEPIIPLTLFNNSVFNVSVITSFLMSMAMFGSIMYIPMFIQGVMGKSASGSGIIMPPMMMGLIVASSVSGLMVSKTGKYKMLALFGYAVMTVGIFMMSLMNAQTSVLSIIINLILFGIGMGIVMPIFIVAVQSAFPHKQVGVVTSSVQFFRSIGGTFGIALMGTLLNSRFYSEAVKSVPQDLMKLIPPDKLSILNSPQALFKTGMSSANHIVEQTPEYISKLIPHLKGALMVSLHTIFIIGFVISAMAFISTIFLKEIPLRKSNKPGIEEAGKELLLEDVAAEGGMMPAESAPDLSDDEEK